MPAYETLLLDVAEGVALVMINRHELRNAVSPQVLAHMREVLADLRGDDMAGASCRHRGLEPLPIPTTLGPGAPYPERHRNTVVPTHAHVPTHAQQRPAPGESWLRPDSMPLPGSGAGCRHVRKYRSRYGIADNGKLLP